MAKPISKQKTELSWKTSVYLEVRTKESLSSFQFLGVDAFNSIWKWGRMGGREEGGSRVYMESLYQESLLEMALTPRNR